jgi:hypothetical protein
MDRSNLTLRSDSSHMRLFTSSVIAFKYDHTDMSKNVMQLTNSQLDSQLYRILRNTAVDIKTIKFQTYVAISARGRLFLTRTKTLRYRNIKTDISV